MSNDKINKILVIDDEPDIRGLLSMTIERMGHHAICAETVAKGRSILAEEKFDLCLTDLRLPDGSGIEIVKLIQDKHTQTPVIVITAHGSMDIAIDAMKNGAFDFINKPVDLSNLRKLINSALNTPKQKINSETASDIIGDSPAALNLKKNISKVSRSQAPVFICGESGSGKELVARSIHSFSSRYNKPFIAVNCGAIPKELMESEFFGHTKGSFTGAIQDKQGLFQSAEGGTLFLDEVADLPMDMQVKLLRAIQEKTIRAVGAQIETRIDVRILSATHKQLLDEIQRGNFRNDLYYRINVIEINVPPLRQRLEDIEILTNKLLKKISSKNNSNLITISKSALSLLKDYSFPGNVRELENILERASALCDEGNIDAANLQLTPLIKAEPKSSEISIENDTKQLLGLDGPSTIAPFNSDKLSIDEYLDNIEKSIILEKLEQNRWNRTTTAKVLKITFRSLRYRMKKLGIDDE
ncbi:MAG: sigma-54-dependent transcriptional regulator [Cellvibrionaceae bacterium]